MNSGGFYRVAFFVMLGALVGQYHRANMAEDKLEKHLEFNIVMLKGSIAEKEKALKEYYGADFETTDCTDGRSRTGTDLVDVKADKQEGVNREY